MKVSIKSSRAKLLTRRRLTPSQQFTLLLSIVLLASGAGLSALAAALVQQPVLGQTWGETQHAIVSHFDSIFGTAVFDQQPPGDVEEYAEHAGHAPVAAASARRAEPAPAFDAARFDRSVQFHLNVYDIVHARFYR